MPASTLRLFAAVTALLLLAACTAPAPRPLQTAEGTVHTHTLENGLRVVVKEDHRAPVVVSQIWYKVGSSYEHGGITGISHLLEHMMFKGTERHPAGEFSRIIAEQGGRENAFTGRDYTAYFQQLERSRLPISFELEADRMRNLLLEETEFAQERRVVLEERRLRTEDNPRALTHEQFMAAAFQAAPYRQPVIGWMDDLENLEVADLRRWYHRWYVPNNATLVVAGDVEPAEVFALAERHFGGIEPALVAAPKPRREPPQRGERRITVQAPAELPHLIMGYKTPAYPTADEPWKVYALEVLAGVLDGGDSARLSRELVRGRQVAAAASAGYSPFQRQSGLLTLSALPAGGHDVAELEAALRREVQRLRERPVAADELARVKAQVAASQVYERDSLFYQAMQIGMLETVGLDRRLAESYPQRIGAVTAEQVQAVAREFLTPDRLTVAILEPQPAGDRDTKTREGNDATR